jgi:uncharacterized protein YbcI
MALTREQLSRIANEMVRIKAQHYGRGPVESRAYQNDDTIFCVMTDGLTTVEQTLLDCGDHDLVRQVRLRFQDQMRDTFRDAVQRVSGREVVAFASQIVFDPNLIFEICVLGDELPDVDD